MPVSNRAAANRHVPPDRLATVSHRMAGLTLVFMTALLGLNILNWLCPPYSAGGYGISFGLTSRWLADDAINVAAFPWWQTAGAILISSVPLLVLMRGLQHLRELFRAYADGAYFSMNAGRCLSALGRAIALWVLAEFLAEPVLSVWVTMLEGPGKRLITMSIDTPAIVALFMAACVAVIGRILQRAGEVYQENQQFV